MRKYCGHADYLDRPFKSDFIQSRVLGSFATSVSKESHSAICLRESKVSGNDLNSVDLTYNCDDAEWAKRTGSRHVAVLVLEHHHNMEE